MAEIPHLTFEVCRFDLYGFGSERARAAAQR